MFPMFRKIRMWTTLVLLLIVAVALVLSYVAERRGGAPDSAPNPVPTLGRVSSLPTSAPPPSSSSSMSPTSTTRGGIYEADDEIRVDWIIPPTISRDGRLRLKVRVLDDSLTLYPDGANDGNGLDVNIVGPSKGGRLPRDTYGEILPPARPGYNWGSLDSTEFVADVFDFDFRTRTLTLEVLTNPRLAGAEEIYASLWTNPPRGETPTWVNRERIRLEESRRE